MSKLNNKVMLMYIRDGEAYPVALNNEQFTMLQTLTKVFEPLQVAFDQPQGKVEIIQRNGGSDLLQ